MVDGKGWFVFFATALAEGRSVEDVEAAVYVNPDSPGVPLYDRHSFARDVAILSWLGFRVEGGRHPTLGNFTARYETRTDSTTRYAVEWDGRHDAPAGVAVVVI
jgi:hypothetical protein